MKHLFICIGLAGSSPLLAQLPTSATKANCAPAGKNDGSVLNMVATDDGGFLALVKQGKSWTVQQRSGDGGIVRQVPLNLAYEKEELTPMFLLRTTAGFAVVADGRDGRVYNEWTALFALDPASLQPGKAQLILHGKPGAHNRLYDLRPGGTVSANGAHAVVWRANVYVYYKEPRIYTLQSFDADFKKVHKWTVKYPDGPGDRFEQVHIDNNGDVYVLAVRDKTPGERKDYGEPSGARSNFEILVFKPGVEEPVTTTLAFDAPVGDVAIHLANGAVQCHGVLQETSGGDVFSCTLDKAALNNGSFAMSKWTTVPVTVKAPTIKELADMDMETRWQPTIDLPDGSSVMVAQYEKQTPNTIGAFYAFYDLDLLVVRRSPNGQLSAVRLPSYQSIDIAEVMEPFVTVSPDGAVRILVNELESNLEEGKSLEWYWHTKYGGVMVEWTIGPDMSVSRSIVNGDWEDKESRAVHSAVQLSDGRVVLPITSISMYHLPLAKRVCVLTW